MDALEQFLHRTLMGNEVWQWLIALGVALGTQVAFLLLRALIASRLRKIAARTATHLDDLALEILTDIKPALFFIVSIWIGTHALVLPEAISKAIRIAGVLAITIQLLLSSRLAVDYALHSAATRWRDKDGHPDPSITSGIVIIRFMVMLVVGVIIVLLALDNMGVAVTSMIAGLGIGGIAVALAVQSILGDLFSSLSILFDKPFVVGDYIQFADKAGTVEQIGVKTSRLRAPTGEQLIVRNSDLLSTRIQNFKRMEQRRVTITFGVAYETPAAKLKAIPELTKQIVTAAGPTAFDRCHLKALGTYSVDFELSYLINTPDFSTHMNTLQAVNLGLLERFAQEKIDFAYPTQVAIAR